MTRPRRNLILAAATVVAFVAGTVAISPSTAGAAVPPPSIIAAWGANASGPLGNGTTAESPIPVGVTTSGVLNGKTPSTVASGGTHTCTIASQKIYCWGNNAVGQLGNGTTTNSPQPVAVDTSGVLDGKTITAITAGGSFTCVLADGKPYCWGSNGAGQLGNNSTTISTIPVAVNVSGALNGKTVSTITAGSTHVCALADNRAYCWGSNVAGELGDGTTTDRHIPVAVTTSGALNGKTVTAIGVADGRTCLLADGAPFCWGYNDSGQLGNNTTSDSHVPAAVITSGALNGKTIDAIAVGNYDSCVLADGKPYCWGSNFYGGVGNNSATDSHVPVAVTTSGALNGKTITAIGAGANHTCVIAAGKPYCWGLDSHGQLGNNATVDSGVPVAVVSSGVLNNRVTIDLDGGNLHTAALEMTNPDFCDATTTAAFFSDIVWLSGLGITTGFADGCFHPADTVTRQAMAAFLYRALKPGTADPTCTGTTRTFTDVPSSSPFCGSIEWLESHGITSGAGGAYNPASPVTRQAMAAFLYRALTKSSTDPTCTGTARTFTDVPASSAFCGTIEWLAVTGITGGYSDGTYRPSGTVTRQAMAAFLHRALT